MLSYVKSLLCIYLDYHVISALNSISVQISHINLHMLSHPSNETKLNSFGENFLSMFIEKCGLRFSIAQILIGLNNKNQSQILGCES